MNRSLLSVVLLSAVAITNAWGAQNDRVISIADLKIWSDMRKILFMRSILPSALLMMASVALAEEAPLLHASFDGSFQAQTRTGPCIPRVEGQPAFIDGIQGKAVVVGGKDRLIFPARDVFRPQAGTCMLWVAPQDWSAAGDHFQFMATIVHDEDANPTDLILYKFCENTNMTLLLRSKAGNQNLVRSILSWQPSQWHHLAATWDKQEISLYIDGRRVAQGTGIEWPADGWQSLILGIPYPGWSRLGQEKTAMDELFVLDRALTPDQVEQTYSQAVAASPLLQKQAAEQVVMKIDPDKDLALASRGAAVITSSFADLSTYYSDNLIDGDLDTVWRSVGNDLPHWIELRWDSAGSVDRLVLHEVPPSRISALSVQSADFSGHWQTVTRIASVTRDARGIIEVKFPAATSDRLRVVVEANGGPFTQLAELEAYGLPGIGLDRLRPYYRGWHIWYPEPSHLTLQKPHYLRKTFEVPADQKVVSAFVQLYTNDLYEVLINGKSVAKGFKMLNPVNVTDAIQAGTNTLAIIGTPTSEPGWLCYSLLCDVTLNLSGGTRQVGTDDSWRITVATPPPAWTGAGFDDSAWSRPVLVARAGLSPVYGRVHYVDCGIGEQVIVHAVEMPVDVVRPGQTAIVRLRLRPAAKLARDYVLTYELGEQSVVPNASDFTFGRGVVVPPVPTSQWPVDQDTVVELPLRIPDYAPHGFSPLRLTGLPLTEGSTLAFCGTDGKPLTKLGQLFIQRFQAEPQPPTSSVATIDRKGPVMAFRIDGKDVAPLIWTFNMPTLEKLHLAAQTGIHLYRVQPWPIEMIEGEADADEAETRVLDQQIDHILRIDPQARVIVHLAGCAGAAWATRHPQDRMIEKDGMLGPPSFFSRQHEQDVVAFLQRSVRYLQGRPYAGAIIGYFPLVFGVPDAFIGGGEGNLFQRDRSKITIGDYNPQAIEAYRAWLRERYGGSVEALRKAWKSPQVTFENAAPELAALTAASCDGGVFRDPAEGAAPFDYFEFLSGALFRFCNKIGAVMRQETDNSKILGVYYGYDTGMLCAYNVPGMGLQDNNFDETLSLSTDRFDFYGVVPSYQHRAAGTQLEPREAVASMDLHKKQYMAELDTRTFSAEDRNNGRQRSVRETVEVIKRDIGTLVIGGHAGWFLDWSGAGVRGVGYYTDPDVLAAMRRGQEIYQQTLSMPHESATQIAVIVSDKSYFYGDIYSNPQLYHQLVGRVLYDQLPHIGASYDTYRIEDLADPTVQSRYKLYIFLNAFALGPDDLKAIENLKRDGKTLLWLYAPGYVTPGSGLDGQGIARTTGLTVSALGEKRVMHYQITDVNHPITRGLVPGKTLGVEGYGEVIADQLHPTSFGPVFHVDDPHAQVLAMYDFGKPALAVRDFGAWRSVYCAAPYMDAQLLRGVAAYAGVHLYTGVGPVVQANQRLLMIHVGYGAPATVQVELPEPHRVTDLFAQRVLAEYAASLELATPTVQTYLLELD